MSLKKITPEDFAQKFTKFTKALSEKQNLSGASNTMKIDEQEQIVELFRIWYFDTREQEMIEEAQRREEAAREDDKSDYRGF